VITGKYSKIKTKLKETLRGLFLRLLAILPQPFPKEVPMEQEEKTVDWLLSKLENLEYTMGGLEQAFLNAQEKSKRYNTALEALTGMCYDEHVHKSLIETLKQNEGEGA
jgi:hypothetical protein